MTEENVIDMEQPIEKAVLGGFVDRKALVEQSLEVTIKGFRKGKFKHPLMVCDVEGDEQLIDLNPTNRNQLIDWFGEYPKSWIGEKIVLTGELDKFNVDGEEKEGVRVTFQKP